MGEQKPLVIGIATALIVAIVFAVGLIGGAGDKRTPEQQARIETLAEPSVIPFSEGRDAIAAALAEAPIKGIDGRDPAPTPAEVAVSLRETIADLLIAYGADSPERVALFMTGRGERLADPAVEVLKAEIAKAAPDGEAPPDDPDDLFVAAWEALGCRSHWEGLVDGAAKIVLWRCESPQAFNETEPHGDDRDLFYNMTSFRHLFDGRRGLADEQRAEGSILVGDVQVAIAHDRERDDERGLYFIRLWRDTKGRHWRPRLLYYVATDSDVGAAPPKLLF